MSLSVCGWSVCLILIVTCLGPVLSFKHKWMAKDTIKVEDVDEDFHQVFTGFTDYVDHFRLLHLEGNFMLVGGRNEVYNISLKTLKEDEERRLTWNPKKSDENLCNSKSDPKFQSKCQNFIQVLGKMDDGKLYVCGTNAFKPTCRIYEYKEANYPMQIPEYVSSHEEVGTGKSPHDPEHNSTAIYSGGKLYSATVADFLGRDPLIMMSENQIILRTAQHDSNMLSEPQFVSSIEIDDMIYIFMRENAVENINCGKATFSRVARICKTDQGGQYEEGVWTSFFKARLNCSLPGDIPFPFNELQATSHFSQGNYMPTRDNRNRTQMFYGVFNTPDNSIQGSAVCAFSLEDVHKAFEGPFKGQLTAQHNWLRYPLDETPTPHPAQQCVNDSKTLKDNTLRFIREHPLMDTAIAPRGGSPVLIQTAAQGRFTAIAIDYQVLAGDRKYYDVMFIGTSEGRVLKSINSGSEGPVVSVVIEDLQVLGKGEAVKELKIFKDGVNAKLIVISKENIKAIPLQRCSRQKSCGECVALQDPYCYWLKDQCTTHTSRGLQDLKHGDRSKCPDGGIDLGIVEEPVVTTEEPVPIETPSCPVCSCNCNQSKSETDLAANSSEQTADGSLKILPDQEDPGVDIEGSPWIQPCEPQYNTARSEGQIYTASTLAIASVISIVVAALLGFVIGYRVSLCRNQARDTEQVINYEQSFGSLRKHSNRHSSINESNFYADPTIQKQFKNNIQQSNILVSNNIANKNPNLPNGSIESKTMTPKQASKTYL